MPKRFAAALVALLVAASTLAVVASPAAAHTQTKQRCAYDPIAGQQCWTETVAHTHTPPPTCGAGTTGTYPNCYPIPSGNEQNAGDEEAKKRAEEARKKAEAERQRKAAEAEAEKKRKADEEAKKRADEEARRQRRVAEEEAKRKAEAEAKRKAAEAEARRKAAEAEAEAERKKAEEEEAKCPARQTGTPPNCTDIQTTTYTVQPCTPYQDPTETYQRHKHPLGDSTTDGACHRHDNSHCPAGDTEQGGHGSQDCRKNDEGGASLTDELRRAVGLFRVGTAKAVEAARAVLNKIAEDHGEAALENAKLNEEFGKEIAALWDKAPPEVKAAAAFVAATIGCVGLVAVAYKSTVATGGTASAAWLAWLRSPAGKSFAKDTCGFVVTVGGTAVAVRLLGSDDDTPSGDSQDGGDDDSADSTDSTDGTDSTDSTDSQDSGTDPQPDADDEEDKLTADDVTRAFNEGNPEAKAILNRYNCQKAHELPDGHWLKPHWTRRFC